MGFLPNYPSPQRCSFQPCQIVCLEDGSDHLYAEVVQTVVQRQICWVRPLVLAMQRPIYSLQDPTTLQPQWYDLRNGADLLLPLALFRAAFDIEVIPLLTYLYNLETNEADQAGHQYLSQFIQRLCQAHPEVFQ